VGSSFSDSSVSIILALEVEESWISEEVSGTQDVVNVVVIGIVITIWNIMIWSMVGTVASASRTLEVNNIVVRVLLLVDVPVVGRVSVGDLIGIMAYGIAELHEWYIRWVGKEVSSTQDVVDVVVIEIVITILHIVIRCTVGTIASVGLAVVVNNIVAHVLLFVDISVIHRVSVGNFFRVSG